METLSKKRISKCSIKFRWFFGDDKKNLKIKIYKKLQIIYILLDCSISLTLNIFFTIICTYSYVCTFINLQFFLLNEIFGITLQHVLSFEKCNSRTDKLAQFRIYAFVTMFFVSSIVFALKRACTNLHLYVCMYNMSLDECNKVHVNMLEDVFLSTCMRVLSNARNNCLLASLNAWV